MALQGQAADVSERIFNELRSKQQDVKYRAANELKDLVTVYSRGQHGAPSALESLLTSQ